MMKKNRITLLVTIGLLIIMLLGYIVASTDMEIFKGPELVIMVLIVIIGIIALVGAIRKDREEKTGMTTEDELSTKIKYKAGYIAYQGSMYMWLFIFLMKDKFPDNETMIGGGVLLSALIFFISKLYVKQNFHE